MEPVEPLNPASLEGTVLVTLRALSKQIEAAAERIAMALYVDRLAKSPEFRAEMEAAERWIAEGCPGALPADEFIAKARAFAEQRWSKPA